MELIERAGFLSSLNNKFEDIKEGEGHCVLISGEAGIGKTSLVRAFCREKKDEAKVYQGTCDALFTPRPLAPLHDIAWQLKSDVWGDIGETADRATLFTSFFQELSVQKQPTLIVFEDIHWADEATLDFIKFFARRITHIRCLFILTYRHDEIHSRHTLRNVLGQLPNDSFTRMHLTPLSKESVEQLAVEKGYSGEDVYSISGGNPFYVHEILASYSQGVPENVKDSILSVFNRLDEMTRRVWELLSVLPTGFEIEYLEKIEPTYAAAIENCLDFKILVLKKRLICFKHELYRRTIESSLSPYLRLSLNKKILDLFRESFEQNHETERIVHHAKNANAYDLVVQYAPLAAKQAASLGAHIEACKLYYSAIEYYHGTDKNLLLQLYELYAYECYLTNQNKNAIIYVGKALNLWKEKNDLEKMGNCMRFLSRLWWYEGNRKKAESFAEQAIDVLANQPSSKAKAMAFSNMSQLKAMSDQMKECMAWGEKAIAIANEIADEEPQVHALNCMGSLLMTISPFEQKGIDMLQQSLDMALKNSYHEHVARAYTALGSNAVSMKDYAFARKNLEDGINYCEAKDLNALKSYMLGWRARLDLETGNCEEAYINANNLLKNDNLLPVIRIVVLTVLATIKMRRGEEDALPLVLQAQKAALDTMELQRIMPALSASLEYEWLTGKHIVETEALDQTINMIRQLEKVSKRNKFYYWLQKTRKNYLPVEERYEGFEITNAAMARKEASIWEKAGCPYERALNLFEGNEEDKREAISIVQGMGAHAVYEKMKFEMRASGIKSIPRGIRKTTQSNPALLTGRELDVLQLLKEGMQNKEIAAKLFISAKTVDHHISSIFLKLDVNSRTKAVQEAIQLGL